MIHHSQTEKRSENKNGNALTARYSCAIIIGLSDGPVAQLDRVSDSDSEGRAFESRRVRQEKHLPKSRCFYISHVNNPLALA